MYLKLTPSGLTGNATANAQIKCGYTEAKKIIEDGHTTIARKQNKSRLAEIRLQQARENL
jgi:hypothetical protein